MGWRKRPPGEGGGYLEDLALGYHFWPVLVLSVSILLLFRHSRVRQSRLRSPRAAGGSNFPTQGGGVAGQRRRDARRERKMTEDRWN
jgi:hypothetical protein